jgi:hypothetical protein
MPPPCPGRLSVLRQFHPVLARSTAVSAAVAGVKEKATRTMATYDAARIEPLNDGVGEKI